MTDDWRLYIGVLSLSRILLQHVMPLILLFVEAAIFLWLVFTQAILVRSCQKPY